MGKQVVSVNFNILAYFAAIITFYSNHCCKVFSLFSNYLLRELLTGKVSLLVK